MRTVNTRHADSALAHLFIRYMEGQITQKSWERLMQNFDHQGMTTMERKAYARFMKDVIDDGMVQSLNVPKPDEMDELLHEIRH